MLRAKGDRGETFESHRSETDAKNVGGTTFGKKKRESKNADEAFRLRKRN